MGKTITWTALSMLYDAGKFQLDDAVENAAGFNVRNPNFGSVPITYRHLYTHTSGLKDDFEGYLYGDSCPNNTPYPTSLLEVLQNYVGKRKNWYNLTPGSKHRYSNMANTLGALLVEKHSGMSFQTFTDHYIFT